jgi:hypothetical protein
MGSILSLPIGRIPGFANTLERALPLHLRIAARKRVGGSKHYCWQGEALSEPGSALSSRY